MCGIFTYVGPQPALPLVLEGLKRLEYRGYDSAGVAILGDTLQLVRAEGTISKLVARIGDRALPGSLGIGHTRWATHGAPTEENAHPHLSCDGQIAVIHNGIIENYASLRRELQEQGHAFQSETDTEVIAHLLESIYEGDLENAVALAVRRLHGTYGLAVVHRDTPDRVVIARHGSPLVIGVGRGEHFAASDVTALVRHTREVIHLEDDELAVLQADGYRIRSLQSGSAVTREVEVVDWEVEACDKNGYAHYMLKEICEQPEVVRNALRGRIVLDDGIAKLGGLEQAIDLIRKKRHLIIVSCGTSFYAGMVARYLFEELSEVTVEVELASEFRYRKLNLGEDAVILAISQSGETADTLAAIREAKRKGVLCLGLVNVVGSTIARETSAGVYNHAGPEIGVASTKGFTSQLAVLTLMAVLFGRHRRLSLFGGRRILEALARVPDQLREVIDRTDEIREVALRYVDTEHFFYMGRHLQYPIALEGALKMKEINYVHAEGYAAGELKHGPIALVDEGCCVVALCLRNDLQDKMISNVQEVRARGGRVLAIATRGDEAIREVADDVIWIPELHELAAPIVSVVPLQLLAYYIAAAKGRAVDKPRNLAKSVTVE